MGMLAKTDKGKEIRKYFLKCEELAKEFVKKNKTILQGTVLTNELTEKYEELRELSVVMADNFLQSISPVPIQKDPVTSENDLRASLVANRIGFWWFQKY